MLLTDMWEQLNGFSYINNLLSVIVNLEMTFVILESTVVEGLR